MKRKKEIKLQIILSENIKRIRKEKKLTQFELAEKADISEMTVKKIETAKQWPSEKTLCKILRALNVEAYNLFLPWKISQETKWRIKRKISALLLEEFKAAAKNATEEFFC